MILQRRLGLALAAGFFLFLFFHLRSTGISPEPFTDPSPPAAPHQEEQQQGAAHPPKHSPGPHSAQNPQSPPSAPIHAPTSSPPTQSKQPAATPQAASEPSRIVVIASTKEEDVNWLSQELPDIPRAIYRVDDPSAEYTVPANKGHESMVYLTYLIDHYDKLPDVMIFLHAHRIAWHNQDLLNSDAVQMISSLSSPYVQRQGYVNMRCHWDPGCPEWMHPFDPSNRTDISKPEERELAKAFMEIFPGRPVPQTMATPCCAQFALSKDAVKKIPLDDLKSWRSWILDTPLPDVISGRVWEYLWHYVFSGDAVVCPRMDVCYCDGFGVCFGGEDKFTSWFDIRQDLRKAQAALHDLEKEGEQKKSEGQDLSTDELRSKADLERKISDISTDLQSRLENAKQRGRDPKFRAQDSGRKWHDGDGF